MSTERYMNFQLMGPSVTFLSQTDIAFWSIFLMNLLFFDSFCSYWIVLHFNRQNILLPNENIFCTNLLNSISISYYVKQ